MRKTFDPRATFDAASIPGMRAKLAAFYADFRIVEEDTAKKQAPPLAGGVAGTYVDRPCPCCGDEPPAGPPVLTARGLDIVVCRRCDLVYSRVVLEEVSDAAIYRGSVLDEAFNYLRGTEPYIDLERARSKYYLSLIREVEPTVGKMLDIGCGTGTFLAEAMSCGWDALGLEPNDSAAALARQRGVRVSGGFFPQDLPDSGTIFQAVTALDVLEHFAKPRWMLQQIWNRLAPTGILFVQVPNWESLLVQIEGEKSTVVCPGHWTYFSPSTLSRMLEAEGFEQISVQTVVTELDLIEQYPSELVAKTFRRLRPAIDFPARLHPSDLYDLDLGYKLIGVFRKKEKVVSQDAAAALI